MTDHERERERKIAETKARKPPIITDSKKQKEFIEETRRLFGEWKKKYGG